MPKFSKSSADKLRSCDLRLQLIFNKVIKTWDCTIVCGHRNRDDQNNAYNNGRSQLKYPGSKHNKNPSIAVDVVPYYNGIGIDWSDTIGFAYFAGYVMRVADEMGISLRWGGDWDKDRRNKDQSFNDLPHFELVI